MGIWDVMKSAFKEGYDGVQKPVEKPPVVKVEPPKPEVKRAINPIPVHTSALPIRQPAPKPAPAPEVRAVRPAVTPTVQNIPVAPAQKKDDEKSSEVIDLKLKIFPMPPQPEEEYPIDRYECFDQKYIPTTVFSPVKLPKIQVGSVSVRGIDMRGGMIENIHPIEKVFFTDGILLRAPAKNKTLDTCQDRAGVVCDERGEVRQFALADGVSSEFLSGQTAQMAVDETLRFLGTQIVGTTLEERLKSLSENIQIMVGKVYRKRVRPNALQQFSKKSFPDGMPKMKAEEAISEAGKGSTTIIAGAIEGNILRVACVADGGVLVFDASGKIKMTTEGSDAQIALNPRMLDFMSGKETHKKYSPPSIFREYKEVVLEEGDYILAFSDGLYEGFYHGDDFVEYFSEKIQQKQSLEGIINGPLNKALGEDDNSVLIFRYHDTGLNMKVTQDVARQREGVFSQEQMKKMLYGEVERLNEMIRISRTAPDWVPIQEKKWVVEEKQRIADGFYVRRDAQATREEQYCYRVAALMANGANSSSKAHKKAGIEFPDVAADIQRQLAKE